MKATIRNLDHTMKIPLHVDVEGQVEVDVVVEGSVPIVVEEMVDEEAVEVVAVIVMVVEEEELFAMNLHPLVAMIVQIGVVVVSAVVVSAVVVLNEMMQAEQRIFRKRKKKSMW